MEYIEKNPNASQGQVGIHFGIGQSSVSTIVKNKAAILELVVSGKKGVKKNRSSKCVLLEQGLEAFYEACRAKKLAAISYDMLITKGREIGDQLVGKGVNSNDLPSTDTAWKSFLQRFLAKRKIKSRAMHGEASDADTTAVTKFFDQKWPDIFASVDKDPSHIWNMDETGLFWRALPQRTLQQADERLPGSKTQKDQLTFAITVSMSGDCMPLYAIGKSKLPRAVAAVKSTPASVLNGH